MFALLCRTCTIFSNNLRHESRSFLHKRFLYVPNIRFRKHVEFKQELYYQKRSIYNLWRKPSIEELKLKDNIPSNWNFIYKNKLDNYFLSAQILTTATASLLALALIFSETRDVGNLGNTIQHVKHYESDYLVFFTGFVLFVVLLQVLLSKSPIRIYNNPQKKEYKMIFYGNVPFTTNSCDCKVGQIIEYPDESSLPWNNSAYLLKTDANNQRKLYLLEMYFKRPADLFIMMGIQSDPDVKDKDDKNK